MEKRLIIPFIAIPIVVFMLFFMNKQQDTAPAAQGESLLEKTLQEMDGVGQVKVYVHYEQQNDAMFSDYFRAKEGKVSGILVVSEGAVEPTIQRELLQVISRVMEIPTHRIMIVPMRNKGDGQ